MHDTFTKWHDLSNLLSSYNTYLNNCAVSSLQIRLNGTNRASTLEGRVEVNYNNGGWGTICDDLWTIEDADVACHMLGFKSAFSATRRASFGAGSGIIWLDDVQCKGTESSLLKCSHSGIVNHNCRHAEDAGVVCSSNYKLFVSCCTARKFGRELSLAVWHAVYLCNLQINNMHVYV